MPSKSIGFRRIILTVVVTSVSLFAATELAWAPFLDNIGGFAPDHPSRKASAATFTAISQFFAAMAAFEVDRPGVAREALDAADANLSTAKDTFNSLIKDSDILNRKLRFDLSTKEELAQLQFDQSVPEDGGRLFAITVASIDRLRGALSALKSNPDLDRYAAARYEASRLLFQGQVFSKLLQ